MRRIALILLLVLCGLTPAQKQVVLLDSQSTAEQAITQLAPTLWLDAGYGITESASAVSAWASRVGAVTFTQTTAANKPALTRPDNLENGIKYSEDLTQTAAWTPAQATVLSATEVKEDGSTNYHQIGVSASMVAGGAYTFAASIKRGTGTRNVYVGISGAVSKYFVLNLANGTVSEGSVTPTIAADGTYYRATAALTAASTGTATFTFYIIKDDGTSSYAGDNASSLLITKAHVRSSLADSTYLPTTTYAQYRGISGRRGVRFDGSNDYLSSTSLLSAIATASDYTMFIVSRPAELGTAGDDYLFTDSNVYSVIYRYTNTSNLAVWNNDGVGDSRQSTAVTLNAPFVVAAWHTGGNIYISANGAGTLSAASGNTSAVNGTLYIGGNAAANNYPGDIAELLTFNKVLSAADRAMIQSYLCRKWGANC